MSAGLGPGSSAMQPAQPRHDAARPVAWWLCPNDPPCPHALHDIDTYDEPRPTCCTEDCPCGKEASDT